MRWEEIPESVDLICPLCGEVLVVEEEAEVIHICSDLKKAWVFSYRLLDEGMEDDDTWTQIIDIYRVPCYWKFERREETLDEFFDRVEDSIERNRRNWVFQERIKYFDPIEQIKLDKFDLGVRG